MNNTTPFLYIIRSNTATGVASNNLTMKLNGLPTRNRHFYCEVVSFMVSAIQADLTNYVVELRADSGFGIVNGRDTSTLALRTIAFTNTNNNYPQSTYGFMVENFNGRSINFQLYDEYQMLLVNKADATAFNKGWILVLKMTPID